MGSRQNSRSPYTPPLQGATGGAPPHSGSELPKAASDADVSEQPSLMLDEWWLGRVEGNEQKIAVAGFFERNREVLHFADAPIVKRHDAFTLEAEDGTVMFVNGFFDPERSLENGYSDKMCNDFSSGFPYWWEDWNARYPKMVSSQTGSQPTSSRTSNLVEDNNGKQPVSQPRKLRSASGKLHHATKSPTIKSAIPYGNLLSPLTRGKAQSSVSTPEYLELMKTRSGRNVVPRLDQGCQNIFYDNDGSICAIIGLDPPTTQLKGGTPKNYARKKKKNN